MRNFVRRLSMTKFIMRITVLALFRTLESFARRLI
jgi:hypothetical protein